MRIEEHSLRSQVGKRSEWDCLLGQLNRILDISDSVAGPKVEKLEGGKIKPGNLLCDLTDHLPKYVLPLKIINQLLKRYYHQTLIYYFITDLSAVNVAKLVTNNQITRPVISALRMCIHISKGLSRLSSLWRRQVLTVVPHMRGTWLKLWMSRRCFHPGLWMYASDFPFLSSTRENPAPSGMLSETWWHRDLSEVHMITRRKNSSLISL